jgi:putative membrane protein
MEYGVWLAITICLALVVRSAWNPTPCAQVLAVISIIIAFAHATLSHGLIDASVFAGICLIVSFSIENIGVATGWPFGHYQFMVGAAFAAARAS